MSLRENSVGFSPRVFLAPKRPRVPHISLVFCELWDTTTLLP
jgi:hypothetical protein